MSIDHDCSACKGNKFDGANVICERCMRPWFMECLGSRIEVIDLMSKYGKTITTGTKTFERVQNKIRVLFNSSSVFCFVCPRCRVRGSFMEVMESEKENINGEWKKKMNQNEHKLMEFKNKLELEEEKTKKWEKMVTELRSNEISILQQLSEKMSENEHLKKTFEQQNMEFKKTIEQQNSEMVICEDGAEEINVKFESLSTALYDQINNQMGAITSEIEARIKLECGKIMSEIKKSRETTDNYGNNNKRPRINENNREQQILETMHINYNKTIKDKEVQFLGNMDLKPPDEDNDDNKSVYEIHVSKFHMDTKESDIEKHICEKLKIKADLVKVEKIMSKNFGTRMERKYISFKIITLKKQIFKNIMDENVWLPHFKVREFKREQTNYTNGKYGNRGEMKFGQRSMYEKNKKKWSMRQDKQNERIMKSGSENWKERVNYYNTPRKEYNTPKRAFTPKIKRMNGVLNNNEDGNKITQRYQQPVQPMLYYYPPISYNRNQNFQPIPTQINNQRQMMQ